MARVPPLSRSAKRRRRINPYEAGYQHGWTDGLKIGRNGVLEAVSDLGIDPKTVVDRELVLLQRAQEAAAGRS